jgi:hypothetical protein
MVHRGFINSLYKTTESGTERVNKKAYNHDHLITLAQWVNE